MTAPAGGGEARDFVLLGSPVGHSLSPVIYESAFRALGVPATYSALDVSGTELEASMRRYARRGGGNVTLPHKERAARVLTYPSEAVRATGSCNCFWGDGRDGIRGDNTDVGGFLDALRGLPGLGGSVVPVRDDRPAGQLDGRIVLLLGAGGGARAVLHACLHSGAARVDVLNRTEERAYRMRVEVASDSAEACRVLEGRHQLASRYDLVVNATSLGLRPEDPLPLELEDLEVNAVFDLVYGTGPTAWVRHAHGLGVPARDGLEMLVCQAGRSLRHWLGVEPPLDEMRRAVRAGSGRP